MNPKWTSRKFVLVLGAALTSLGAALSGNIEWDTAMKAIIASVVGYLGVEGLGDVAERWKNGAPKPPGNGTPLITTNSGLYVASGASGSDEIRKYGASSDRWTGATPPVDMRVLPGDEVRPKDSVMHWESGIMGTVAEVKEDGSLVVSVTGGALYLPRSEFVWLQKPRR